LGLGKLREHIHLPKQIPIPAKVQSIVAGDAHNFAITTTGRVYGWGMNKYAQCGFLSEQSLDVPEAYQATPKLLDHIRGVQEIAASGSCAAGYTLFTIVGERALLHQHIRDLNSSQVSNMLRTVNPSLILGK
jgi:alpha-tubulin suppressor-like RCC1 family protein